MCPVCPKRKARGWNRLFTRQHVLAKAKEHLDGTYTNDKNVAHHRALARKLG
jgi:hypothetical protein